MSEEHFKSSEHQKKIGAIVQGGVHVKREALADEGMFSSDLLAQICMEDYDGRDWGKCTKCSAHAQKAVWVDRADHFSTKYHAKAARNSAVDPGMLLGVSVDAVAPSPAVYVASVNVQQVKKTGSRACIYYPEHYCVRPELYRHQKVIGCFLIDSLSQMVTEDGKCFDHYMERALTYLWETTGKVYMAVCAGGSALVTPCAGGMPCARRSC